MPIPHIGPELTLAVGAIVALIVALIVRHAHQWLGAVIALATLGVAGGWTAYLRQTLAPQLTFSGTWALDEVTAWGRWIVIVSTALVVALSPRWFRSDRRHGEWYALVLLCSLGSLVLIGAADTMELMVGALLVSVTGYTLASYHRRLAMSAEAGAKYFLVGALANPLLLLGITLLYGTAAATGYGPISIVAAVGGLDVATSSVAAALIVVGLAFELGAFPAHPWVPDVAQGSPAPAAALLTVVPKVGALIALGRVVQLLPASIPWRTLVAVVALVTMTIGNLAALRQRDVRRLLGWSSVSQVGYGLMAVAALGRSALAVPALVTFALAYSLANVGAFAVVVALRGRTRWADYRGLARVRPFMAFALSLCLLSLTGIPPLVGFTAKALLFGAAIESGFAWLAFAAVVNTVISIFYYLRVITQMAFPRADAGVALLGRQATIVAVATSLAVVAAGVASAAVVDPASNATLLPRRAVLIADRPSGPGVG